MFFFSLASQDAKPFLSPCFSSHMVMQREKPNTIWGWTRPGAQVKVEIGGKTAATKAAASGKWTVKINPPSVGGPYTMKVDGPQHEELTDILVGDVWVCSGQSNMEMGIAGVRDATSEISSATFPNIRLFMVPKVTAFFPQTTVNAAWYTCSPDSIAKDGWGGFSAVGYFFGRELYNNLHVPIGLVETSWGGTIAEAWTSAPSLRKMGDFNKDIDIVEREGAPGKPTFAQRYEAWFKKNDAGTVGGYQNVSFNDASWQQTNFPATFNQLGKANFDGVLWMRRTLDLPHLSGDIVLSIGLADDSPTVWVNGSKIGEDYGFGPFRQYRVPAGLLREGSNTIAIRLIDTMGEGGFNEGPDNFNIKSAEGTTSIAGTWKYIFTTDLASVEPPPVVMDSNPNVPTVLYNGMIAPLQPLAIKGAIWYQGESNAGRGWQYRTLLPTMISDWRKNWAQGDFPFYIVQLANFQTRHEQPVDDAWAEVREAQAMTARQVHNAGMAVTIDIGERGDIHPRNKQDVGKRLALNALHLTYGRNVEWMGPTYRSSDREGDALRIRFDHASGLMSLGRVRGFAIAGRDRKFYWASGVIEGNSVVLRSPQVKEPIAARYAWDMDPEATLYNSAGLPAGPFRTDNWPLLSQPKG